MKLSDINPNDVQMVAPAPAATPTANAPGSLTLAGIHPDDVQLVSPAGAAPNATTDQPGALEAFLRGGAQGGTLGFSDEIAGGGKALFDKILGNDGGKAFSELYAKHRDEARQANAAAQAAHPWLYAGGNAAGGLASGVLTGGLGAETALGRIGVGAGMGALGGAGYSNEDTAGGVAGDAIKGGVTGGVVSGAVEGIANALNPSALEGTAEKLAVKATGATGKEASNYADDAGRQLLDRGIVKFGSSPEDIANNAEKAMVDSGRSIQDTLENQLQGTTVDRNDVISKIEEQIKSMAGDDSQTDLVKALQSRIDNIKAQIPEDTALSADVPETAASEIPISKAEEIKRGYQNKVKNWNAPAVETNADAIVSDAYRGAVEDAATEANPAVADQFKADKDTWGLLSPVQKAAERRANVLNQSPLGGLLDVASGAGGGAIGSAIGGPVGTVVGFGAGLATKALRPRLASMAAVGADRLADVVRATPEALGPFRPLLEEAAQRGSVSLAATNTILMQTNEAYRTHMKDLFSGK